MGVPRGVEDARNLGNFYTRPQTKPGSSLRSLIGIGSSASEAGAERPVLRRLQLETQRAPHMPRSDSVGFTRQLGKVQKASGLAVVWWDGAVKVLCLPTEGREDSLLRGLQI